VLAILAAIVAVAVVSTTAVGAFYVWDAARAVQAAGVSIGGDDSSFRPRSARSRAASTCCRRHRLVRGANAALSGACQNGDTEGERNDVTMLVHISDAAPRDGRLVPARHDRADPSCTGPDGTQYSAMSGQMLNASYMYGGLSCTVATIEKLTGVDIQFAAATRWTGVINMSDAIGGVDVCVADDISDSHTGLNLTKGTHTLQGRGAAVPAHPSRHRRRIGPRAHLEPAAVHELARAQAAVRRACSATPRRCSTSPTPRSRR
jgi:LCP family protein required for cell wall assembly